MATSRILLVCLFCSAAFAQSDRDFGGRWVLNPQESELAGFPGTPDKVLKVEQTGPSIQVWRVKNESPVQQIRSFFTDGRESRLEVGSETLKSVTKWEGAALLVSIIVLRPHDEYSMSERWKLTAHGRRLTIRRELTKQGAGSEATLVYDVGEKRQTTPLITRDDQPEKAPRVESANPPSAVTATGVANPDSAPSTPASPLAEAAFVVPKGTTIPLRLINSVSTKHSVEGDKVYLQTIYPILSHGKVIIPPGSYVTGSLGDVKQAGRIKGKSEFFLRFDILTLPNGTTRDFRSRMSGMDGDGKGTLDRSEGGVRGDGGKGSDAKTVGVATATGASIGVLAGNAAGHAGMGAGIGAAAGALGGLAAVLATRGPAAVLEKGSTVEMVLDRDLSFSREELRP